MSKTIPYIIPAYEPDEQLLELLKSFGNISNPIIIVNDGSGKEYDHIYNACEKDYNAIVLKHAVNQGKGRALKTAFSYCIENFGDDLFGCVTADSDGQHDLESIKKVENTLLQNNDKLILGVREFTNKELVPFKSRFGNNLTSLVFKLLYKTPISDTQTGLRGIPKAIMLSSLHIDGERFEFETNMLIEYLKSGQKLIEEPINTIYESVTDHKTHFNPITDAIQIYSLFFGDFIGFIISSLSSCILDMLLFSILCFILKGSFEGLGYIPVATVIARIISATYNYLINYKFVFKSHKKQSQTLIKYAILAILQVSLSAFLTTQLCSVFPGLWETLIKVVVDTLLFFMSYLIQKKIIY